MEAQILRLEKGEGKKDKERDGMAKVSPFATRFPTFLSSRRIFQATGYQSIRPRSLRKRGFI
jgi:hypothetical protein